ncbi:hypothetical protein IWQ60_010658 [Tieghemiomyces parasiticus]|uniref:Mediator of RNA polymerase II transcription subunit 20 n=1 Tax=Tieghemiomyces parasiticus TaxID=78921 RepID=A0A9W7ZKJ5_9FUNG|nr:hypothetical protein IWQ60_010658 [Tieghemiomyces parasiticus]
MGASTVFRWVDATGSSSLTHLTDRITKHFHGTNVGRWNISCKLYREVNLAAAEQERLGQPLPAGQTKPPPEKFLMFLTDSTCPARPHAMVNETIVHVDREFELIVQKMKNLWSFRQSSQIDGHEFDLGDFSIKAGNIIVGTSSKGVVVEIEYRPCIDLTSCRRLLAEFIELLLPPAARLSFAVTPKPDTSAADQDDPTSTNRSVDVSQLHDRNDVLSPDYARVGLNERYCGPIHSAYQFFTLFRKDGLL